MDSGELSQKPLPSNFSPESHGINSRVLNKDNSRDSIVGSGGNPPGINFDGSRQGGGGDWRTGLLELRYRDIDDLLAQLGLYEYAGLFAGERVSLDVLSHLTKEDLKEMGLPMGPRVAIWKEVHPENPGPAFATPY